MRPPRKDWTGPYAFSGKKRRRALLEVTELLLAITQCNAPLPERLQQAAEDAAAPLRALLLLLAEDLSLGLDLHEAMRKRPAFFSPGYAAAIEAAERSGNLEPTLETLEQRLRQEMRVADGTRLICFFLITVLGALTAVGVEISTLVMPKFLVIQRDFADGGSTPLPTLSQRFVLEFTQSRAFWPFTGWAFAFLPPAALACVTLAPRAARRRVRYALAFLPGARGAVQARDMACIASIVEPLIASGVPLTEALAQAERADVRPAFVQALKRVRSDVENGAAFADAIQNERAFSPSFRALSALGDRSGMLPESFQELRRIFEGRMLNRIILLRETLFPVCVALLALLTLQFQLAIWQTILPIIETLSAPNF